MAKKGPKRSSGGVRINPNPTIPISDELFMGHMRELLSPDVYHNLLKLPEEVRQQVINNIKSNLYNVSAGAAADPTAIFLGEFGDVRGVQVGFNFESFAKNPTQYLRSLPKEYLSGIIRQGDIELEVELETVQELLAKGGTSKAFSFFKDNGNHVQMLESQAINIPGRGQRVVEGAKGIGDIGAYKDYSTSIVSWVANVQSLTKRERAKAGVRAKLSSVMAQEFLTANGWRPKMTVGNDPLSQAYLALYPNWNRNVPMDEGRLLDLLLDRVPDSDFKKAFKGFESTAEFRDLYTKELAKSATGEVLTVENIIAHSDPTFALGAPQRTRALNSYSIGGKVNKLSGVWEFNSDLKEYITQNMASSDAVAKSWGFSSSAALLGILDSYYGDPTSKMGVVGTPDDPLFAKMFKVSGSDPYKLSDVIRFRDIMLSLNDTSGAISSKISDRFMSYARYGGYKIVDDLVDSLPANLTQAQKDEVRSRLRGATNWMRYVEVRSDMEAQEEFIKSVGKGSIFKAYFFAGKYNSYVPKGLQELQKRILASRIPGLELSVNDYISSITGKRDSILSGIGFVGKDSDLRRIFSVEKTLTLRQSDFNPKYWEQSQAKPFLQMGQRAPLTASQTTQFTFNNLFNDGVSWDILGDKYEAFSKGFFTLNSGQVVIKVANYKMLPTFLEATHHLIANTPGITEGVIKNYFALLAANRGLIDVDPAFAALRASPNFLEYRKAIFDFFDQAKSQGIAEGEYLSFAMLLKQKGLIEEVSPGNFKLLRYAPLLDEIANKLSRVQTYIYEMLEEKVLKNILFKVPKMGAVYKKVWGIYNPKYGGLNQAESLIKFLQKTPFGAIGSFIKNSTFVKGLWAGFSRLLPAFMTTATAGTAYLAIIINRFWQASFNSFIHLLKGRFNLIEKEFYAVFDDLIAKPIAFFFKTGTKIIVYTLLIMAVFVTLMITFTMQTFMPKIPAGSGGTLYGEEYFENVNGDTCSNFVVGNKPESDFVNNFDSNIYTSFTGTDCPGWRNLGGLNLHTGMDFAMGRNTPLVNPSSKPMVVEFAGHDTSGYGNLVILKQTVNGVDHFLYFAHLLNFNASSGDVIQPGQQFANSDHTGWSTGDHLHFELRVGSRDHNNIENPCTILKCPASCTSSPAVFDGDLCNNIKTIN